MRRRDFIKVIGGGAAAWPLVVRAQQPDRIRRIGVLSGGPATDDPDNQARWVTLTQALQQLGWIEGRNLQIDYRLTEGNADRARKFAAELIALNPDVIVASGTTAFKRCCR
jgi:putative ABC transport system substrate-binding protein